MVERLGEFVMPYQQALKTEDDPHSMHLYLQGLLSHLPRKNAEAIAAWVDVERQVMQDFIGIAPWDHRPLIGVLVGQVAKRLGAPDGIIAFDPSSFPKRGTHSVGVKRQWCGPGARSITARSACSWGTSRNKIMPCSISACLCPKTGHAMSNDTKHATYRQRFAPTRGRSSAWRCSRRGVSRCRTAGSPVMMHWVATHGFAR